jgi:hypothetical protein
LGFFKEFYNSGISIINFSDIRAIKGAFILAFIKHFLDIIQKQVANILNINIPDIKVKLYYLILASFILKAKNRGLEFLKFL